MNIKTKFNFFDIVYLISDTKNDPRVVVSIQIMPYGTIKYELEAGATTSWHYEDSISKEKQEHDYTKQVGFKKI